MHSPSALVQEASSPAFIAKLRENHPDAFVVFALDGTILVWNPAAESTFGHGAAEALGRSVFELIVPKDYVDEERQQQAEAIRLGMTIYESVRQRKDGALLHVNVSTKVVRDDAGAPEYFISNKKDVTHLKVAREAKLVGRRFGELLEITPEAIVLVNVTGRIVLVNSQAEQLFGMPRAELIGQPVEVLLPRRFHSAHLRHRVAFGAQPRKRTMGDGLELFALRRGGEEFPVEISLSPIATEEGPMVMSAIRDITERKRFQQTLSDKNIELEQAALVKDRFFASMSHELRTPLNAVIGFTGTLLMQLPGPLNAEQERQLHMVQSGARHLLSLINDVLDLARLEAKRMDLDLNLRDCSGVISHVVSTLKPEAEKKGLALSIDLQGRTWPVRTDRRALSQILLNLVGNAVKFTDSGHVRVRVLERAMDGQNTILIEVDDSGPGISEQDGSHLFEAFSRGSDTTRKQREGSGLGLHLSRRLAQALGGSIAYRSEPGKGSVFTLALPGE